MHGRGRNNISRLYDRLREALDLLGIAGITIADTLQILAMIVSLQVYLSLKATRVYLVFGEQCVADTSQQHHGHKKGNHGLRRHC